MRRLSFKSSLWIAALIVGIAAGRARATVITYQASGTGTDGALAGSATFTTGAGFLDVSLTNLLGASVISSPGQALSDIYFTLSNAPGILGTTTAAGQQGDVGTGGVVTYVSGSPVRFLGNGPSPPGGSGTFSISGDTILMEALGGGQPSEMIIPFIANGSAYTNANGGFTNNFSPYTIGTADFTLDLSGITASTTVTAATFSFGTGPDTCLPGTPVPEPGSLALFGIGLLGLGLSRRRKAVRDAAA